MKKRIYIFTGGTINKVSPHFALSAPAYGTVGCEIYERLQNQDDYDVILMPTAMAFSVFQYYGDSSEMRQQYNSVCSASGVRWIETNDDLSKVIDHLKTRKDTRCIIMSCAVADFKVTSIEQRNNNPYPAPMEEQSLGFVSVKNGYANQRLESSIDHRLEITADEKIIKGIRSVRKDIFLVSFKATYDQPFAKLYEKALSQVKSTSSNLVFANDIERKINAIVTPEEYPYPANTREEALDLLCEMTLQRLNLHFERTSLEEGRPAFLKELCNEGKVPENFLEVLSACIDGEAFKPFNGRTAGHFGCKVEGEAFQRISSIRKVNHNHVFEEGMAKIFVGENGEITAQGGKPSVGEHTQQMIYDRLGDKVHSIIHFHCPLREDADNNIPIREQAPFECGSMECSVNCIEGMSEIFEGLWAVHLKGHGPNVAFHKNVDPDKIFEFILDNWDLKKSVSDQVLEELK